MTQGASLAATTATSSTTTEKQQRPMFLSADKRKISYRSKNGSIFTLQLKNAKVPSDLQAGEGNVGETKVELSAEGKKELAKEAQTLWPGVFDTIAMFIEESLEVACFGPYDEPQK